MRSKSACNVELGDTARDSDSPLDRKRLVNGVGSAATTFAASSFQHHDPDIPCVPAGLHLGGDARSERGAGEQHHEGS